MVLWLRVLQRHRDCRDGASEGLEDRCLRALRPGVTGLTGTGRPGKASGVPGAREALCGHGHREPMAVLVSPPAVHPSPRLQALSRAFASPRLALSRLRRSAVGWAGCPTSSRALWCGRLRSCLPSPGAGTQLCHSKNTRLIHHKACSEETGAWLRVDAWQCV